MAKRNSSMSSQSAERRAALDALAGIAGRLSTDALIAYLPVLTEMVATGQVPLTAGGVRRFTTRLRCLRRWAELGASPREITTTAGKLDARVAAEEQARYPDSRVSARTVRHWRDLYNRQGPGGLAGGPAALLDHYITRVKRA